MSGKLDQSLDEILSTQRKTAGRRRSARGPVGRPAKVAPIGGIQKTVRPARGIAAKPNTGRATGAIGESKIVVSNLPKDVSEGQIKEYFTSSVGPVRRVELSFGPGGTSRGIATITFSHADGASKAFTELNGLLIDNRPVKVEVVVASADLIPQPKKLGQRISHPKVQPKSAAAVKNAGNVAKGAAGAKGAKRGGRKGRTGRPTKKTAEELDSEMADYFTTADGTTEGANGAAPAANADAPMEDEIM